MIKLVGKSDLSSSHWTVICHRIWLYGETSPLDFIFSDIKVALVFCSTASKNEIWVFLMLFSTKVHTCLFLFIIFCLVSLRTWEMKLLHVGLGETKEYVTWLLTFIHFAFSSLLRASFVVTKAVLRWQIFVLLVSSWQLSRIASKCL